MGNVEPLISLFPHAEVRVFADSGHGVVPQNWHVITAVIKQLLQR